MSRLIGLMPWVFVNASQEVARAKIEDRRVAEQQTFGFAPISVIPGAHNAKGSGGDFRRTALVKLVASAIIRFLRRR